VSYSITVYQKIRQKSNIILPLTNIVVKRKEMISFFFQLIVHYDCYPRGHKGIKNGEKFDMPVSTNVCVI